MDEEAAAGDPRTVICPQCTHEIPGDARTCPNCRVDLALLALLAERAYLDGIPETAPLPPAPEGQVPRLGEFLIKQGILTEEQLAQALDRQKTLGQAGTRPLLGQTLVQMGLIDPETLDRAVTSQIIELHSALQEVNQVLEQRVSERTKELRHALERVTELNQIKANLISNVSHELRTPLAHIKGYVELLEEQQIGPLNADQEKAMSVMLRATLRLENLIEDLISFSTASREGLSLKREEASIEELAQGVVGRSRDKAEKAGVQLVLAIGERIPAISADCEKLGWVLYQLVDNGIKFTPSGGTVTISAAAQDGWLRVAVEDTGIGIPADRIEEIFEPFHQLDGSPTRRYGGTGLGLTLAQQILTAHGATMQVESKEHEGSTFRFDLPLGSGKGG